MEGIIRKFSRKFN